MIRALPCLRPLILYRGSMKIRFILCLLVLPSALVGPSYGRVTQAFTGADLAFIVTDFYSAKTPEREIEQGRNAIDAAKGVGKPLGFLRFSSTL